MKEGEVLKLKDKKIGFILTGSSCTFKSVISQIKNIIEEQAEVIPIMSDHAYELDTKFGKASDFINQIEEITKKKVIHTIQEAEVIGTKLLTDIMIIAPASGNTIAKMSNGISDNVTTIALKSNLRNRQSSSSCNSNR